MKPQCKYSVRVVYQPPRGKNPMGKVLLRFKTDKEWKGMATNIEARPADYPDKVVNEILYYLKTIYCIIQGAERANKDLTVEELIDWVRDCTENENPYEDITRDPKRIIKVPKGLVSFGNTFSEYFREVIEDPEFTNCKTLLKYIGILVAKAFNESKTSSLNAYRATIKSLARYLDNKDIDLSSIDETFILNYQQFLEESGIVKTTVSFYIRVLRRVLNQAQQDGLVSLPEKLFSKANTFIDTKNASSLTNYLTKAQIQQLSNLEIEDVRLDFARDIFMFSYYMRGLELSVIANLRYSNIQSPYIIFKRKGSESEVKVVIDVKALEIIEKYRDQNGDYLFPLLKKNEVYAYQNVRSLLDLQLTTLGESITPKADLTFTMAKATWHHLLDDANLASNLIK